MLDKGTGNKSWRERGVGEVRILQHRELGNIRLLMRQEKTMKVIANHQLDPRIELSPNVGSDRSWVWRAFDFSDGVELVETMFACRFKDSDVANEFKVEFKKRQEEMKKFFEGADDPGTDGGAAADEAAAALAGLSTKEEEEEPKAAEESS
jgi:Ran-binding protein 1